MQRCPDGSAIEYGRGLVTRGRGEVGEVSMDGGLCGGGVIAVANMHKERMWKKEEVEMGTWK